MSYAILKVGDKTRLMNPFRLKDPLENLIWHIEGMMDVEMALILEYHDTYVIAKLIPHKWYQKVKTVKVEIETQS